MTAPLPKLPPLKSERALNLAAMLNTVLALLNRIRIRATYGAVADVLGTNAQNVGKLLGDRRPEASWVVADDENGRPSGYTREQEHPALYDMNKVIRTGDELRGLLNAS